MNGTNDVVSITSNQAKQLYFYLVANQYVDMNGKVTDNYKNDAENNTLKPLPDTLQICSDGIHALVQRVYDNTIGIEIENANSTKLK